MGARLELCELREQLVEEMRAKFSVLYALSRYVTMIYVTHLSTSREASSFQIYDESRINEVEVIRDSDARKQFSTLPLETARNQLSLYMRGSSKIFLKLNCAPHLLDAHDIKAVNKWGIQMLCLNLHRRPFFQSTYEFIHCEPSSSSGSVTLRKTFLYHVLFQGC